MKMMKWPEGLRELMPAMVMVLVQVGYAGSNVLYKLASDDGMNLKVIIAYRFVFSTVFILPIAFVIERKSRPKLTWIVLFQAFLCGLFGGSLAQCLYLASLKLTSPTYVTAMTNLIPAFTFIFALSCGLEKLNLGERRGKAKILGTLMGVGGAILLTLYKGVEIDIWSTHIDFSKHGQPQQQQGAANTNTRVFGCLLGVASCASLSLWLIIQAKMSERYPCPYSSTALMSIMGSAQILVYALCTETDWKRWKLGWDIRLLTVAYAGIVATALAVVLITWCVRLRGPLFVSVFNPLTLVLVAIASSLFLGQNLHLGCLLAAVLIVLGLYLVLWGKGKKIKKNTRQHKACDNDRSLNGDQPAGSITVVIMADQDTSDHRNKCREDHDQTKE